MNMLVYVLVRPAPSLYGTNWNTTPRACSNVLPMWLLAWLQAWQSGGGDSILNLLRSCYWLQVGFGGACRWPERNHSDHYPSRSRVQLRSQTLTILYVFGLTRSGIGPRSPAPQSDLLTTGLLARSPDSQSPPLMCWASRAAVPQILTSFIWRAEDRTTSLQLDGGRQAKAQPLHNPGAILIQNPNLH